MTQTLKIRLISLVFGLAVGGSTGSSLASTMVVLGDSLSEGYGVAKEASWPSLLEKKLNENLQKETLKSKTPSKSAWKIINAGVSGSTTASGISRIKWLAKQNPDYLFLALGANDGLRGLQVSESQKHLQETIDYAISKKIKVILGGLYMPPNYGQKYTREFGQMYLNLAKKNKVLFVPFILEDVAGNPKFNLADGIHPNEEGHKKVAENIYKSIEGKL